MVEGTGFENQRRGNLIESSNLSVSAGANKHFVYLERFELGKGSGKRKFPRGGGSPELVEGRWNRKVSKTQRSE